MSEQREECCRYCGGARKFRIVSSVSDGAWASCFCSREAASQAPQITTDWQQAIGGEIARQCGIGAGTCVTADDGSGLFEVHASLDLNGFAAAMQAVASQRGAK